MASDLNIFYCETLYELGAVFQRTEISGLCDQMGVALAWHTGNPGSSPGQGDIL